MASRKANKAVGLKGDKGTPQDNEKACLQHNDRLWPKEERDQCQ